jgi:hypothetical protein
MPRLRHFYGQGHYHYLTENIYRRARILDSDRFKRQFVQTVGSFLIWGVAPGFSRHVPPSRAALRSN